jgi:hypothetical protein
MRHISRAHTEMKRLSNALLLTVFLFGVMVYPAMHRMSCGGVPSQHSASSERDPGLPFSNCNPLAQRDADTDKPCSADTHNRDNQPAPHDVGHCPICQLAQTPMSVSVTAGMPLVTDIVIERALLRFRAPTVRTACILPFSCGPPA